MLKENESFFFPEPTQELLHHLTKLNLNSNCECSPCKSRPEQCNLDIHFDSDLEKLRNGKKNSVNSDFIVFLQEIFKHAPTSLLSMPILDTVVFNSDGSVKFVVSFEEERLKFSKLNTSLKNHIHERKYFYDLEFQKKKFIRENLGFSFTQLDNQSEKYIKEFENNIKFMNPQLNQAVIIKKKEKAEEEIMTKSEINSLFSKVARKVLDFTLMEYIQIFPIMHGFEEMSYTKKVKYFRSREMNKKNYKLAEHYVGNWYHKNESLENLEKEFLLAIKDNEEETLLYFSYKLFIFFQKYTNKMVDSALLVYITNDEGNSFLLKNIECLSLMNLHEVGEKVRELPKKLEESEFNEKFDMRGLMKNHHNNFQRNFHLLEKEGKMMQLKKQKDIDFSNEVYKSLGNDLPESEKQHSFIKWISEQHLSKEDKKLKIEESEELTDSKQKPS